MDRQINGSEFNPSLAEVQVPIVPFQLPIVDSVVSPTTLLLICVFQAAVPFAVVGSSQVIEVRGRKVRGRMYPWGVVEVENPEHCDFIKLRTMLM